jgi:hypothetical protein
MLASDTAAMLAWDSTVASLRPVQHSRQEQNRNQSSCNQISCHIEIEMLNG